MQAAREKAEQLVDKESLVADAQRRAAQIIEQARLEAMRCLQCKNPGCVDGCPVGVDIPGFIKLILESDFTQSIRHIWQQNSLPAVCGRVCPQEIQCEGKCILAKKGEPVAIGNLERFAADWERANGTGALPPKAKATGKKVAVVGASGYTGMLIMDWLIDQNIPFTAVARNAKRAQEMMAQRVPRPRRRHAGPTRASKGWPIRMG